MKTYCKRQDGKEWKTLRRNDEEMSTSTKYVHEKVPLHANVGTEVVVIPSNFKRLHYHGMDATMIMKITVASIAVEHQ